MSIDDSQSFLRELDRKLWTAADKLRSSLDAAVYKHAVLGLIFLKYVSDAFTVRQNEIEKQLRNPKSDYFLDPAEYKDPGSYEAAVHAELEDRDYYVEKNVFWVPALARWKLLQDSAKLPQGTEIDVKNGKTIKYKISSVGKLIDDALDAVEKENPRLKNVLNKTYTQLQIDPSNLSGLIDLIATIPFEHAHLHAKDILGHVYEYFLGQFAIAEGKNGGQYYTPKSIVSLIVQMLEPYKGRVYDPAMGSGGFFVQSEKFIEDHGGKLGSISIYGQESNATTWRLAAMNMAIRGIEFDFGQEHANSFTSDLHPDLRADFVLANPPFNISDWWDGKLEDDARWKYGMPPKGNANFAWVQHMLYHLSPTGNGRCCSPTAACPAIRRRRRHPQSHHRGRPRRVHGRPPRPALHQYADSRLHLVPDQVQEEARGHRDRSGETLFIDARKVGYMMDRVLREFTDRRPPKDRRHVRRVEARQGYADVPGFCKSATMKEIEGHGHVLTPGRYVGAEEVVDDGEPFEEKMARLVAELNGQFAGSAKLEAAIKANLGGLGYEL